MDDNDEIQILGQELAGRFNAFGRLFAQLRTKRVVSGAVAVVFGALSMTSVPARAAVTFDVEVGRFFDPADHSAESMRFFPETLRLHQGDIVHFTTESFHGVSLLPAGQDAESWAETYAGGVGRPWSAFQPDPDDEGVKVNARVLSPSQACGWPTQSVCSFDGSDANPVAGVLHSGLALFPSAEGTETRQLDFSVAIDADPGQTIEVVDVLHPAMHMRIEVVAADEAASDPIVTDEDSDSQFAKDERAATALDKQYRNKKVKKRARGKTTWSAWAGLERTGFALRRFYPAKLTIKKGDRVKWIFSQNLFSAHTVTFPAARGRNIAGEFPIIVCDPDGDIPESPDQEPQADSATTSTTPPYCDDPSLVEFDVPDDMARRAGNRKVTKASDFESSGVRGAGFAISDSPYTLRFTKASPRGYSFVDMVGHLGHFDMAGKVVVKP